MALVPAILSFLVPGLGQLLQGRVGVALVYGFLWLIGVLLWGIGGPDTFFFVLFGEKRIFPIGIEDPDVLTPGSAVVAIVWSWAVAFLAARDAWQSAVGWPGPVRR